KIFYTQILGDMIYPMNDVLFSMKRVDVYEANLFKKLIEKIQDLLTKGKSLNLEIRSPDWNELNSINDLYINKFNAFKKDKRFDEFFTQNTIHLLQIKKGFELILKNENHYSNELLPKEASKISDLDSILTYAKLEKYRSSNDNFFADVFIDERFQT